jgi:hypothetical protein
MNRVFRYISGEVVCHGDRMRATGYLGRVTEVFQPASDTAAICRCPEGGMLILSDWEGIEIPSIWTPPDGKL